MNYRVFHMEISLTKNSLINTLFTKLLPKIKETNKPPNRPYCMYSNVSCFIQNLLYFIEISTESKPYLPLNMSPPTTRYIRSKFVYVYLRTNRVFIDLANRTERPSTNWIRFPSTETYHHTNQ